MRRVAWWSDLRLFLRWPVVLLGLVFGLNAFLMLVALGVVGDTGAILLVSGVFGFVAGQVVQELQHTSFFFQLPGRCRPALALAALGVVVAILFGALGWWGGPGQAAFAAVVAAVGFPMGAALVDPISRRRTLGNAIVFFGLVALGATTRDPFRVSPLATAALGAAAVAVTSLGAVRLFSTDVLRAKPFVPTFVVTRALSARHVRDYAREKLAHRAPDPAPRPALRGVRRGDRVCWGAALRYEAFGTRRFGLPGLVVLIPLLAVPFVGFGFWEADSGAEKIECLGILLYAGIFEDPVFRGWHEPAPRPSGGILPLMIGIALSTVCLERPLQLRPGVVYPLSRARRATVHFREQARVPGALLAGMTGIFLGVGVVAAWQTDVVVRVDPLPRIVRVALVAYLLLPLLHAYRLRHDPAGGTRPAVHFAVNLAFVVAVVVLTALLDLADVAALLEIPVLAALVVLSRAGYGRWLRRFFARADLAGAPGH